MKLLVSIRLFHSEKGLVYLMSKRVKSMTHYMSDELIHVHESGQGYAIYMLINKNWLEICMDDLFPKVTS